MAKEFLSQQGVTVQEKDVSRDAAAAAELARLGQRGVPVTVADGEVVVGFDRQRLAALARRRPRPSLGLRVSDSPRQAPPGSPPGAYVADVHAGTPAARAGLHIGDIVTAVNGRPVRSADDLAAVLRATGAAPEVDLTVARPDGVARARVRLR